MKRGERKEGKKHAYASERARPRARNVFYATCALMRTRNSFEWNKNYPFTDISGPANARGARGSGGIENEESGRVARESRETLFSTSIYAHVPQTRARARARERGGLS